MTKDAPAFRGDDATTENAGVEALFALLPDEQESSDPGEEDTIAEEAESLADEPEEAEPREPLGAEAPDDGDDEDLLFDDDEGDEPDPVPGQTIQLELDGHVREMTAEQVAERINQIRSTSDRQNGELARTKQESESARQAYEAKATALDGLLADLSRLQETGLPSPPDPALAREDPAEYIAQKADYEAKRAVVDNANQEAQRQQAEAAQQWQRDNATKLFQAVPAWKDATRLNADLVAIQQHGIQAGWFDEATFGQNYTLWPHWALEAAHKAILYDRAVARKNGTGNDAAPAGKRVVKTVKTVRSQASQPESSRKTSQVRDARQRFLKNPSGAGADERAVELLLAQAEAKGRRQRRA
jgi:hypothetical protein